MICVYPPCAKKLKGQKILYCDQQCHNKFIAWEKALQTSSTVKTGKPCKWCTGAEEGFCCNRHESQYINLRKAIDSELARRKPEPTDSQLKGYKKIAGILINSETLNR